MTPRELFILVYWTFTIFGTLFLFGRGLLLWDVYQARKRKWKRDDD